MMLSHRTRRGREFRGPAPGNVAIIAKNPKSAPVENIILESRRKQEELNESLKNTKALAYQELKNTWERETKNKITNNVVKRRVKAALLANEVELEGRRDRLRELLRMEEESYLQQMEDKQETVLERQAKMRERAKFLKDKRDEERKHYVEEKLEQRWRDQCEELRATRSKRLQDEVSAELVYQMQEKLDAAKERETDQREFARLWHEDMLKKAAREEREAKAAHERSQDMVAVLHTQMAALEARKEDDRRLIEQEAELLRKQEELRQLELAKEAEDKRRKHVEAKQLFESDLRLKMRKRAKEEQEQLAFDMKVLEQLLQETANEAAELSQRKTEQREENLRYMAYLKELAEVERQREAQVEAVIQEEVEKNWQKRLAQWRLEKEARQKMLREVMAERAVQIREKLSRNEKEREEAMRERAHILKVIEENKLAEEDLKRRIKTAAVGYQSDLLDQISYGQALKKEAELEEIREFKVGQQAEFEYQSKLKSCLDEPFTDPKMHPMRKHFYCRSAGHV